MVQGPPYGNIQEQGSGNRCLKTQSSFSCEDYGHGRSDLLALGLADCSLRLRLKDRMCISVRLDFVIH